MADEIHVKGMRELGQFLQTLPDKLTRNIMRSALRAGGAVILARAKQNVPVAAPSSKNARLYGGYAGALRDSGRVSTRYSRGVVTASVKFGGKGKGGADVYYAHMVEQGTDPHVIRAANRGKLAFAGGYYSSVNHPGAAPRPYLVPAMDSEASRALVAVGEAIKKRLTKQGLNVADIDIEVES